MLSHFRLHAAPIAFVTVAKVVGGVSLLALNVWVARRLGPAAYGSFALASAAALLVDGVLGSAVDAAVIRLTPATPAPAVTAAEWLGVIVKAGAGAILSVTAVVVVSSVAGLEAAWLAGLAMVTGTGLLALRSVLVYLQLRESFGRYAAVDLTHTAVRWIGMLAAVTAAASASPITAIAAFAVAAWGVGGITLMALLVRHARSASHPAGSIAEMWRATVTALATTGVGAIVARLDLFVIGAVASASEAGIFGAAATLALAPTVLGAYLAPVFSARILPYCREQRMRPLLRDVQRGLVALAVAGVALGVIAGPYLIERLLPADYGNASAVLQVLVIAGAAGFVTFPLVLHTLLFLSPRTYLLMDLASIPLLVPAYVVAARESGAIGVAWVTALSSVAKAAIAQLSATAAVRREQERLTTLQPLSTVVS